MTGILQNSVLTFDSANQETVTVLSATATTFTANFVNNHSANCPIVLCEGSDPDGFPSVASPPFDTTGSQSIGGTHSLHFTINLANTTENMSASINNTFPLPNSPVRENYFSVKEGDASYTPLPPPLDVAGPPAFRDATNHVYSGQRAEVVYFLVPEQYPTTSTAATPTVWTGGGPGIGLPLFNLYRRLQVIVDPVQPAQINDETVAGPAPTGEPPRVAAAKRVAAATPPPPAYYYEISARPDPSSNPQWNFLFFNTPQYLTIPERRFGMYQGAVPAPPNPLTPVSAGWPLQGTTLPNGTATYPRTAVDPIEPQNLPGQTEQQSLTGSDLLLSDVISFDVQVFWPGVNANDFINIAPQGYAPANNNSILTGKRIYDTWSQEAEQITPGPSPLYYNPYDYSHSGDSPPTVPQQTAPFGTSLTPAPKITAIKITLRIWDVKTQKTRQITIVQDV
jgi:hypothetical protein